MTTAKSTARGDAIQVALRESADAELARRRLLPFCERIDPHYERARHLELLADRLEALERRDIRRLIVAMPPRHGKSRTCSQLFASWLLGRRPDEGVVLASYGSELAEQNSRRVREIVSDERFPFDVRVSPVSHAVNRWQTTSGGVVIAAGIGSSLTGFGADAMIVDDPVADRAAAESPAIRESTWSWFQDVARTRLHAGAIQLLIATRWHEDDVTGRVLNSAQAGEWELLNLPAIAEEHDALGRRPGEALWDRFPLSELPSVERGEISSRSFAALYQQRPVPAEGHIFKANWFEHRYVEMPPLKSIVVGADCAAKTGVGNDFSAIVTIGTDGKDFFVRDVVRERLEFADLARRIVGVQRRFSAGTVYIEDASSGTPLVQELRRTTSLPIVGVPPRGTKVARAEAVSGLFEAGKVRLPRDAPWIDIFIDEFLRFPAGKHDDQVDATSLTLERLRRKSGVVEWSFAFASNDLGGEPKFARPR
jgi:predicted phage terminase large subunit-like protein